MEQGGHIGVPPMLGHCRNPLQQALYDLPACGVHDDLTIPSQDTALELDKSNFNIESIFRGNMVGGSKTSEALTENFIVCIHGISFTSTGSSFQEMCLHK